MTKEEAKEMLTNTKVYVNGKSKEIQEKLFEIGVTWFNKEKEVMFEDAPFLYMEDGRISFGSNMNDFKKSNDKEISAEDILNIKLIPEFKRGDIVYLKRRLEPWVFIFKEITNNRIYDLCCSYLGNFYPNLFMSNAYLCTVSNIEEIRLATEEEKTILFDRLKERKLYWNKEEKKLEEVKKEYEFKPFDKVLIRDSHSAVWHADFFEKIGDNKNYPYTTLTGTYTYCIPYEGNEKLLGTNIKSNN